MTDDLLRLNKRSKRQLLSNLLGLAAGILFVIQGLNWSTPWQGDPSLWNKPLLVLSALMILLNGSALLSRMRRSRQTRKNRSIN